MVMMTDCQCHVVVGANVGTISVGLELIEKIQVISGIKLAPISGYV